MRIILPQAMRVIIPPTGNQFIAMLKDSSLVSVVGVWELMYLARTQGQTEFRHVEMMITASMIYWIFSIMLELIQAPHRAPLRPRPCPLSRGPSRRLPSRSAACANGTAPSRRWMAST